MWTGHEMVIWSGAVPLVPSRSGVEAVDGGAAFDPDSGQWRMIAAAPIAARYAAVTMWTGTEMVVWGGLDRLNLFNDGAAYNPTTDTWRKIADAPLAPAAYASAVWTGAQMLVFGGITTATTGGLTGSTNKGAAYDPVANTWKTLPNLPDPSWSPTQQLVWTGTSVVTAIAKEPDMSQSPNDASQDNTLKPQVKIASLTPDANHWVVIGTGTEAGQYLIAIASNASGLQAGQILTTGTFGTSTEILDSNGRPLRTLPDRPDTIKVDGLQTTTPIWTGQELLLWSGGYHGIAFNPQTGTWRTIPGGDIVTRRDAAIVWTRSCLIGWGGSSFDPANTQIPAGATDGILYRPPPN